MSKRYGDEKASAVEITPMDRMVLLVMRGRGCDDGAAACACFMSLRAYCFMRTVCLVLCCSANEGNVIVGKTIVLVDVKKIGFEVM